MRVFEGLKVREYTEKRGEVWHRNLEQSVKNVLPEAVNPAKKQFIQMLYRQHFQGLSHFILRRFGAGPPDPEDISHNAFIRIASLHDPCSLENPKAYLYRIASNLVLDHKRQEKIKAAYLEESLHIEEEATEDFSPENVSLVRERINLVFEAMKKLPVKRRQIFVLNRYDGMTFTEIGRQLGMSESGVRKHVKHALSACMDALAQVEDPQGGKGE